MADYFPVATTRKWFKRNQTSLVKSQAKVNVNKKALETIQNQDTVIVLNSADIEALKKKALLNERKRIRINLHHGMDSQVHEMIIVHCRNNYVRPHKHSIKAESFHIIEG